MMKILIDANPKEIAALVLALQERRIGFKHPEFCSPTLQELEAYKAEMNLDLDVAEFLDYYNAKGWKTGSGVEITDWRPVMMAWESHEQRNKARYESRKESQIFSSS